VHGLRERFTVALSPGVTATAQQQQQQHGRTPRPELARHLADKSVNQLCKQSQVVLTQAIASYNELGSDTTGIELKTWRRNNLRLNFVISTIN